MASISVEEMREASLRHASMLNTTKITMNKICSLPLSKRAIYSDPITKKYAKEEWFVQSQLGSILNADYTLWNLTSIANISYMILHSNRPSEYLALWNKYKIANNILIED